MKEKKIKSLVIIPAFNEEASIRSVVEKIRAIGYDYLVINDCSSDNTEKILTENNYNHLRLPINLGIAGVTQVGFKYALDNDYDCVVCIDGDGQHDPSYIPSLTEKIENGREYVVGSRFIEEKKAVQYAHDRQPYDLFPHPFEDGKEGDRSDQWNACFGAQSHQRICGIDEFLC